MEKIQEVVPPPVDQQEPQVVSQKLSDQGSLTLRIMYEQFQNILKMGLIGQVPGFSVGLMPQGHEKESQAKIKRFMAMMDSMTDEELDSSNPKKLMNELRIMQIARGSGGNVREVTSMFEEYERLAKIWSKMKELKIPKNGDMNDANHMSEVLLPPQMLKQVGGMVGLQNLLKQISSTGEDKIRTFGGADNNW